MNSNAITKRNDSSNNAGTMQPESRRLKQGTTTLAVQLPTLVYETATTTKDAVPPSLLHNDPLFNSNYYQHHHQLGQSPSYVQQYHGQSLIGPPPPMARPWPGPSKAPFIAACEKATAAALEQHALHRARAGLDQTKAALARAEEKLKALHEEKLDPKAAELKSFQDDYINPCYKTIHYHEGVILASQNTIRLVRHDSNKVQTEHKQIYDPKADELIHFHEGVILASQNTIRSVHDDLNKMQTEHKQIYDEWEIYNTLKDDIHDEISGLGENKSKLEQLTRKIERRQPVVEAPIDWSADALPKCRNAFFAHLIELSKKRYEKDLSIQMMSDADDVLSKEVCTHSMLISVWNEMDAGGFASNPANHSTTAKRNDKLCSPNNVSYLTLLNYVNDSLQLGY